MKYDFYFSTYFFFFLFLGCVCVHLYSLSFVYIFSITSFVTCFAFYFSHSQRLIKYSAIIVIVISRFLRRHRQSFQFSLRILFSRPTRESYISETQIRKNRITFSSRKPRREIAIKELIELSPPKFSRGGRLRATIKISFPCTL